MKGGGEGGTGCSSGRGEGNHYITILVFAYKQLVHAKTATSAGTEVDVGDPVYLQYMATGLPPGAKRVMAGQGS